MGQDTWKGSIWEPWTQNLYVYTGNNPVNYVDPTGHDAVPKDDSVGTPLTSGYGPEAPTDPYERLDVIEAFFSQYGLGAQCIYDSNYGCGQAVLDFMQWELESRRLDVAGNYWDVVNRMLTQDMLNAQYAVENGLKSTGTQAGDLWMAFVSDPSPETFWNAHSVSLYTAHASAVAQAALNKESAVERRFVKEVVVPAAIVAGPTAMALKGPRVLWDPSGPGVKRWVNSFYQLVPYQPPS